MPAAKTRASVLRAARLAFSRAGFDHVGIREIGAMADIDPAVVIRLFGSKEALFEAVAAEAFDLEPAFLGPVGQFGERVARHLLGPQVADAEFDAFQFLLRSAASPVAAPILSRHLEAGFMTPLADLLGGEQAAIRASLATAAILGFSTLRFTLTPAMLASAHPAALTAALGRFIQAAIEAPVP